MKVDLTREKNAEDFSDFGESDDEILNQEEVDKSSNRNQNIIWLLPVNAVKFLGG